MDYLYVSNRVIYYHVLESFSKQCFKNNLRNHLEENWCIEQDSESNEMKAINKSRLLYSTQNIEHFSGWTAQFGESFRRQYMNNAKLAEWNGQVNYTKNIKSKCATPFFMPQGG